jgi:hypothetical protein
LVHHAIPPLAAHLMGSEMGSAIFHTGNRAVISGC